MKKLFSFSALFLLFSYITLYSQTATPPSVGDGSSGNPYQISTLENLYWLSQNPSEWDKNYIQTAEINAAFTSGWDEGQGFSPIGNSTNFTGTYNGSGHTIDSLFINRPSANYSALFGYIDHAKIDSLSLAHANISGDHDVGGLIGFANKSVTSHCSVTGKISGNNSIGGLIGYNYESPVSGCYSKTEILGSGDYTGGLIGYNHHYSSVRNCHSEGTVTGDGNYTGGLAGENRYHSVIEACYSNCKVIGANFTGGLIGLNDWAVIRNTYSTGDVSGNDNTGGLAGSNSNKAEIYSSYSYCKVSATGSAGGLIGTTSNSLDNNSFWDTNVSGMMSSTGGTGKTTGEMKDYLTFTDTTTAGLDLAWNFPGTIFDDTATADIWDMGGTQGYPIFMWEDSLYSLVTSDSIPQVEVTSATAYGNIQYLNPATSATYGFCWNTGGNPVITDPKTVEGPATTTGSFSSAITGLQTGTKYYARAYITNTYGTTYGKEFTFVPGEPMVVSISVTHITDNSAHGHGNITHLGAANPTAYGFCWNTTGDPDITNNKTDEGSIDHTGTFTTVLTPLQSNEVYYARAYVTNAYGTTYGKVIRFQKTPPPSGSGTEVDPYRIATLGNLRWLMEHPDKWDQHYIQTADIYASETDTWDGGNGFSPIGTSGNIFSGTYKGIGHTIKGLYINRPDNDYTGMFGYINNGKIDSLSLTEGNITGKNHTGGLIGFAYYGTLHSCSFSGTVEGNDRYTGGLAGKMNFSSIDHCYAQGEVTSSADYVGGIIGDNHSSQISYSFFTGNISGNKYVGGLVGLSTGPIDHCYSRGRVSSTSYYAGGLVGDNLSPVNNCYSRMHVGGTAMYAGGLIGMSESTAVSNCYSTGTVHGNSNTGGLIGILVNNSVVVNSFWDTLSSGLSFSAGGTPKATAELKDYRTFTDLATPGLDSAWDFSGHFYDDLNDKDYWNIGAGNEGYLCFSWEDSLFTIVSTDSINNIESTSATGTGHILYLGSSGPVAHGYCWNTMGDPTISNSKTNEGAASDTGTFSTRISELTAGQFYHTRAYATNLYGTFYAEEKTFLAGGAMVLSDSVSGITATMALAYGNITDLGASDPTAYGFCWNNTGSPTLKDHKTNKGATHATGPFSTQITGLFPGTVYYARAYVTNAYGTKYGKEITFVYAPAPTGSGTKTDPYRIKSLGNLRWLVEHPDQWNKYYIQTANIYAGSTTDWEKSSGFIPIGNTDIPFTGEYHGGGYIIDSLYINRPGTDCAGLFGYANLAFIDSLGLPHAVITGNDNTGALAGYSNHSKIKYCYSTGEITGSNQTGGLVGWNNSSAQLTESYSKGNVHCTNNSAGGLVGYNYHSTVSNCFSTASVYGGIWYTGGLAGDNRSSVISNCYSTGDVDGKNYVGGFCGWNNNASLITKCYSTGKVTGNDVTGGFVASNSNSTVSSSFWDTETSGISLSQAGTGKTTSEMKDFRTFVTLSTAGLDSIWDFVGQLYDDTGTKDYWGFTVGNDGYLSLTWQDSLLSVVTTDSLKNSTSTSIQGNGNLVYLTPSGTTAYGFCWNTIGNPDITDAKTDEGTPGNTGHFITDITGLTEGETYYARAYVTNQYGTYYSRVIELMAGGALVSTDSISGITDTIATGHGKITDLGASHPTAYGFCWNTMGNPTITDNKTDEGVVDHTGTFTTQLTGLISGTIYFARAYATNGSGTFYGEEIKFVVAPAPSGTGTYSNPYRIASLGNLRWLTDHPEEWDKNFLQTKNIDATPTKNWNENKGFLPIGNITTYFKGKYRGHGYIIRGLYIYRPDEDYAGLFGLMDHAQIDSLGLTDVDITGNNMAGGITGYMTQTTISSCFSTGKVLGNGNHIGGLIGYAYNYSTVTNCYNMANVSGTENVGGLIGWNRNYSNIYSSYSTGKVSAVGTSGGLVGLNNARAGCTNSFWNIQSSGMNTSACGTGKTTLEMKNISTFTDITTLGLDNAWDFTGIVYDDHGTSDIWGFNASNLGYPALSWEGNLLALVSTDKVLYVSESSVTGKGDVLYLGTSTTTAFGFCWNTTGYPDISSPNTDEGSAVTTGTFSTEITGLSLGEIYYMRAYISNEYGTYYGNTVLYSSNEPAGSGTEEDPYRIASLGDLLWMMQHQATWDKYFVQTADINARATAYWYEGKGFSPLGNNSTHFSGTYHGQGYIIDSLFISRNTQDFIGLFGYTSHAVIDSLGITHADITGNNNTGSLTGYTESSTLRFCYTTGKITGAMNVGGMVGNMQSSNMDNCFSMTDVTAEKIAGGLAGTNWNTPIYNTYSTGIVLGGSNMGGLIGYSSAAYLVTQSFWDTLTSGQSSSSGGNGKTTAEMKEICTYTDGTEASWDFKGETDNGSEDIWGMNVSENNGYPFLSWQGYIHTGQCCSQDTSVTQEGATLTANITGNASFRWYDCNAGTIIAGETDRSFTATENGSYAVIITSGSCTDTSSCHNVTLTGIDNTGTDDFIRLYPNPARDRIYVQNSHMLIQRIEVMDINGKIIKQMKINEQEPVIDMTCRKKGLYLVKIITDKKIIIKKVMIK